MTVKIDVKKELGLSKPIIVKETNKNFRKTLQFQKDVLHFQIERTEIEKAEKAKQEKLESGEKVEPTDELTEFEEMEHQIDMYVGFQDIAIDYITEILHLSDTSKEKLEELGLMETQDLAIKISSEIMGTNPEEATTKDKGLGA